MEIITAKTNAVVTLSTMSVLSFHWRRVWQLNTRLVHFQECSKSVQITFHLIQNEMFKDLFKRLLQSLQASTEVKRPRSQTVRPKRRFSSDIYKSVAVKFVFSKLANFVGTSLPPSSGSPHWIVQLVWMFFNQVRCVEGHWDAICWKNRKTWKSQDFWCLWNGWFFVGIPNSASCSQAKGRSPTRHLPLTRESRHLRHWRRTMWQCRVEFLGNKKTSEVFQFKACVGTKDGNFVPNFG